MTIGPVTLDMSHYSGQNFKKSDCTWITCRRKMIMSYLRKVEMSY